MALIQCPECGKAVSSRAAYCPECGHPIKNNNKRKIVIFSIVIAIIAVIAVGVFFLLDINNKPASKSEEIQIQITPKFSEAIRQYDELTPFSEGMAAVRKGNKWGYINHEGALVIPCKYSIRPSRFSEGLACVEAPVKPAVQFINKNGEIVLKGNFYYGVEFEGSAKDTLQLPCFNNGVCAVWTSYMTGKEAQTFFIDKNGAKVSNANYATVSNTDNHGLVRFIQDEKVGYKSPDGTIPIPAKYSYLSDFNDGVALAKISSKDNEGYYADDITIYGYVDLNGNSTFSQQDYDKITKIIETKTIERNREKREREEQIQQENNNASNQNTSGNEAQILYQLQQLGERGRMMMPRIEALYRRQQQAQRQGILSNPQAQYDLNDAINELIDIKNEQIRLAEQLGDPQLVREYKEQRSKVYRAKDQMLYGR